MPTSPQASWSFDRIPQRAEQRSMASPAPSASPASSPKAPLRKTLSVKEYHSEHSRRHGQGSTMEGQGSTNPGAGRQIRLARDELFDNLEEEVDYESDTQMGSPEEPVPRSPEPAARERLAPNPFPDSGAAQEVTALRASSGLESGVVTNPLDEVQERQLEEGEVLRSQRPRHGLC
jgi:hypothetical protein